MAQTRSGARASCGDQCRTGEHGDDDDRDREEGGPGPRENRRISRRVTAERVWVLRRPTLAVGPLFARPTKPRPRDVGRRVENRREVLLEYPVLEPGLCDGAGVPSPVPLLDVQQTLAHVLIFARQSR